MMLAMITARGGSKRIPRKNIRPFCGKPIIAYSIEAARQSGCFDEIMVSTDDAEIADVAHTYGAIIPFPRSPETSGDHATTAAVIVEVIQEYQKLGRPVNVACCLYPTAPFVTPETLRQGLRVLESDSRLATMMPVTRYSYPIQRSLRVLEGRISLFQPEHLLTRSQDLETAYHDAGQFYWLRTSAFLREPSLMTPNTGALVLPEWQVQDIDNEDDWILAEAKFEILARRAAARQP